MYRIIPYLPLFLALSTSSPFWQGLRTGLKSYRFTAYGEYPRSGIPELLRTTKEFDTLVDCLVKARAVNNAGQIWWAIRPSSNHPTLELRILDCCTLVDDSVAIAALYRTIVHHLFRNPQWNADIDAISRVLTLENQWRAQRYGVNGTFVTAQGAVSVGEILDRVIDDTSSDARMLGSELEVERCREIVRSGTSADTQLALVSAHASQHGGLNAVTDWIARATLE